MIIPASTNATMNACIQIHEGDTRLKLASRPMTPEPRTPAERAEAVLRAAEAAAAAATTATAGTADQPPGADRERLLELADELDQRAAHARHQLDELEAAFERLAGGAP